MLSLIEIALFIAYLYFAFIRKQSDNKGIKMIFILSALIAIVNTIELLFIPLASQNLFSIILTVLIIVLFGANAKRYYDLMDK